MPTQYTRTQLEALPTAELIKLFNTIAGKQVTRFSSRKAGIKQLLNALAERARETASPKLNVRTVRNGKPADGSGKAGRPTVAFSVKLNEAGKSEVRSTSLRGQIIAHLKSINGTATVAELEAKFGDKVRGAVQKLMAVDWLKRTEPAA